MEGKRIAGSTLSTPGKGRAVAVALALALLLALVFLPAAGAYRPSHALALDAVVPLDPWPAAPQMTATTGDLAGTFTVSDSTQRLLVVLVCSYDNGGSSGQTFAATYGGRALALARLENSNRRQTWIGYLQEADIAARSGDALAVTITGAHSNVVAYIASYAGVDQASPITGSTGAWLNNKNNVPIGGPLAANPGGCAIYGWSGTDLRISDTEGYSEHSDVNTGAAFVYGVASKLLPLGGSTDPAVTWSGNNLVSVSFITLNPGSPYPAPVITGISPAAANVDSGPFTLTVDGSGFALSASVVRVDGVDRATTWISSGRLTADIPAADLAAPGDRTITVFTLGPGGGTSNEMALAVRIVPAITWESPADIVYGTALGEQQLCATAPVPGTFAYTPEPGTVLAAGDGQTLRVTFAPTDNAAYTAATRTVTINVARATLVITASGLSKTYGTAVTLPAAGFQADGLVNGDTVNGVTLTSAGAEAGAAVDGSPYSIVPATAVGTGLANYNITYVNGALTVEPAAVTMNVRSQINRSTEGDSVTLTATATGSGATGRVTFLDGDTVLGTSNLIDGSAVLTVPALSAGRHAITAVYGGDTNFAVSSSAIDLWVEAAPAPGSNWALIGGLLAVDGLLCLLLLTMVLRRRHVRPAAAAGQGMGAGAAVGAAAGPGRADPELAVLTPLGAGQGAERSLGLPTVEDVGTYSVQLEWELDESLRKVEKTMEATIQAVCRTIESRDPYVAGHQKRVAQLACAIGKEMGLAAWQVDGIRVAGLLHDIGKITVPTEILSKPGRLSSMEMAMMKHHPKVAFDILKTIEFDWPIAQIVVQHHERMDGSGYPAGTRGEDILLEARILAVADVVEAMSSYRPYRDALGVEAAIAEIQRGKGTLYDPQVVEACMTVVNQRDFRSELNRVPA